MPAAAVLPIAFTLPPVIVKEPPLPPMPPPIPAAPFLPVAVSVPPVTVTSQPSQPLFPPIPAPPLMPVALIMPPLITTLLSLRFDPAPFVLFIPPIPAPSSLQASSCPPDDDVITSFALFLSSTPAQPAPEFKLFFPFSSSVTFLGPFISTAAISVPLLQFMFTLSKISSTASDVYFNTV